MFVYLADKFVIGSTSLTYPVYVQPKLDGNRALAYRKNEEVFLMSRNGLQKRNPLTHIKTAVKLMLFPDSTDYIDGELYTHGMPREQLNGLCNKLTHNDELSKKIEFHMFDFVQPNVPNVTFEDRYKELCSRFLPSTALKLVQTDPANSQEEIIAFHQRYANEGYEGIIIRKPDGLYENKRYFSWWALLTPDKK